MNGFRAGPCGFSDDWGRRRSLTNDPGKPRQFCGHDLEARVQVVTTERWTLMVNRGAGGGDSSEK